MHLRISLVHDVCTELGESVDDPINRILVSGNQRARQNYSVALANLDVVLEVRHACQNSHRLTLRTGRHVNELVVGNVGGVLRINQHAVWNI